FGSDLHCLADFANSINHKDIGHQHTTGNPAQQRCTKRDNQREAVDQLQNQGTAPDDDGHTDDQAEDHVVDLMIGVGILSGTSNGNDVIQAHHQVGNQNCLDSTPY